MENFMKKYLLLCLTFFGLACSSSTAPRKVDGTYALTSIDNQSVPIKYDNGVSLVKGSLVLKSTGDYTVTVTYAYEGQQAEDGFSGTYTLSGHELTFCDDWGCGISGEWDGANTVTVNKVSVWKR
jgi:hypothetical protein